MRPQRARRERERCAHQEDHQAAEHVQLGVQVDDHVPGVPAAVEELVDGGKGLDRSLERADAPTQYSRASTKARTGVPGMTKRTDKRREQEPERREHRDARSHDQEGVKPRCLFGLLGRQPVTHHEPPLVEAEVERNAVERERPAEQGPEAQVRDPARRCLAAERGCKRKERARRQHRETGDQVDVRVTDRIDPLTRMPGLVEPVRMRRLDLDHALHRPDGQTRRTGGEELPEMPARLRHANEARLEDRQEHVRRETPVTETHHPRPDADRHAIRLAHVQLRRLVVPTRRDESPDRDPVRDQRDVEDEETDRREPESALRKPGTGQRTRNDSRQDVPAEPGRDQRAAADDHHVRIREVAHEMSRIAGAREPVRRPRQVLQHHVNAAEQEERAACEEVLRQAPVVRLQLVIGVRLGSHGSLAPRQDGGDRSDHHREERRIRIELQRREALGEHGLPKTRFEEVDRQRPDEVDHDQDREHDPGRVSSRSCRAARPLRHLGNRREVAPVSADRRGAAPSEDLLHHEAPRRCEARADVGEQPLEGVAALEEHLELSGRVPGGVAVDEHVTVSLRSHEHVEALASGVLLDVTLERLKRCVDRRPERGREHAPRSSRSTRRTAAQRRPSELLPPDDVPDDRATTANPTTTAVRRRKNPVAGLAASVVQPPKLSTG